MNYSDMIEKAKYISRKRVGNKYVYKYADDKRGGGRQKKEERGSDISIPKVLTEKEFENLGRKVAKKTGQKF